MKLFLFLLVAFGLWSQGLQAQGVVSERGQAASRRLRLQRKIF